MQRKRDGPADDDAILATHCVKSSAGSEDYHTKARGPSAGGNRQHRLPSHRFAQYSKDTAGKQRMETCLDQYKANKANNANGGLKWIQKGGGYYSECNKHLKGSA